MLIHGQWYYFCSHSILVLIFNVMEIFPSGVILVVIKILYQYCLPLVIGIKEETQRSDIVMISIVTSVMVLVLILVIVMVLVVIIITQLQTRYDNILHVCMCVGIVMMVLTYCRKFYHHSWLSCGKPELVGLILVVESDFIHH